VIYIALGEKDQAMAWLEKGYEERFNPGGLERPCFDRLRSDPGFQNMMRRIGLPSMHNNSNVGLLTDREGSFWRWQLNLNPL
jgi:hypothetical protein